MDHGTNLKLANKLEAHKQRNFKQQELGEGKKAKEVSIANLETEKKLSDPDKIGDMQYIDIYQVY